MRSARSRWRQAKFRAGVGWKRRYRSIRVGKRAKRRREFVKDERRITVRSEHRVVDGSKAVRECFPCEVERIRVQVAKDYAFISSKKFSWRSKACGCYETKCRSRARVAKSCDKRRSDGEDRIRAKSTANIDLVRVRSGLKQHESRETTRAVRAKFANSFITTTCRYETSKARTTNLAKRRHRVRRHYFIKSIL